MNLKKEIYEAEVSHSYILSFLELNSNSSGFEARAKDWVSHVPSDSQLRRWASLSASDDGAPL